MQENRRLVAAAVAIGTTGLLFGIDARSQDLPPAVKATVDKVKARMVELASDPMVVAAVREANAKTSNGMNNGKWIQLTDSDPLIHSILSSPVSQKIRDWESQDKTINKLLLRDANGNLVGASVRPLIYNNSKRPVFANAIKGEAWAANEIKPDTTTQVPSVHVSAPVMDGGRPIGVLHTGANAN